MNAEARSIMKARVRNDFTNHAPVGNTGQTLDKVTERCIDMADFIIDNVPPGREQSSALTNLEQVSMWAKAGIARNQFAST